MLQLQDSETLEDLKYVHDRWHRFCTISELGGGPYYLMDHITGLSRTAILERGFERLLT